MTDPSPNEVSILTSTKKSLGITEDNTDFDPELILYINSIFTIFNQLGLGASYGVTFSIEDKNATWDQFIGDADINAVTTLMYIRVRLLFDPPQVQAAADALKAQADEFEWRLNVIQEDERRPNG